MPLIITNPKRESTFLNEFHLNPERLETVLAVQGRVGQRFYLFGVINIERRVCGNPARPGEIDATSQICWCGHTESAERSVARPAPESIAASSRLRAPVIGPQKNIAHALSQQEPASAGSLPKQAIALLLRSHAARAWVRAAVAPMSAY